MKKCIFKLFTFMMKIMKSENSTRDENIVAVAESVRDNHDESFNLAHFT